jgi:glycosyltransferase involved in cell wall biosynthesis
MSSNIELSIVILCYRAGRAIKDFANKAEQIARKLSKSYEIVLVGNYIEGSDDCTKEVVQQLAGENPKFKAICKPKKGMMGWDMKEGLKATVGDYICVIDGDGQFPLESIEKCFLELKKGEYDLVKTFRKKRSDGIYRKFISIVYNIIFSVLFPGLHSKDINSKPKIFTRKAYSCMELKSDDWFIDAEIMLNIRKHKMKFHEFPVEFFGLESRASFVKFQAIFEFVRNLIAYRIKEFKEAVYGKNKK